MLSDFEPKKLKEVVKTLDNHPLSPLKRNTFFNRIWRKIKELKNIFGK